ncbi:MAG: hypothetical protein AAGG11_24975 [Pseudomonadota bacterium]
MFHIPGTPTEIPALLIDHRNTSAESAWLNSYNTVQLYDEMVAIRVHVGGGIGAVTEANQHLAGGAGLVGRWYAIGDFIKTYDDYISSTALPPTQSATSKRSFFTLTAVATFSVGAILNVGRAGPLFDHPGGAEQAEHIHGPGPSIREVSGTWANRYGNA